MNVVWKLVPYDVGIPAAELLDLARIYPECPEFPGDSGFDFMIAEGFEGFAYTRMDFPICIELTPTSA